MQLAPTVSVLTAALFCAVSSVASPADAEPLASQKAQPPAAKSPGPSRKADTPPERSQPQSQSEETAPERASLRLSVGFGGGSVGVAARVAADVEYWPFDNAGVGVLGALGAQSAVIGSSFSYAFIGPALLLRDRATESGFFATAAFGFMNGSYTSASGDFLCFNSACEPVKYDIRAPGVVLEAGLMGRAGSVDLGGALAVDLISAQLETPRWIHTVTLNVIVGIPLD